MPSSGGLCETCLAPGACCRGLFLSGTLPPEMGGNIKDPMSRERAEHVALRIGLPFVPAVQLDTGEWTWNCLALGEDGRCTIYEDRPNLCRRYAAGTDPLCVHYHERVAPGMVEAIDEMTEAANAEE